MKKMAVLLIVALLFCSVAPTHAANFVSRSQMIAYLEGISLVVPGREAGSTATLTIPVDDLTDEELDDMIGYVGEHGTEAFEAFLVDHSRIRNSAAANSRASEYIFMDMQEGWNPGTHRQYELVEWYNPDTGAWYGNHEYLEDFSFLVQVTEGVITDTLLAGFAISVAPEYLSFDETAREDSCNSTVAYFRVDYDLIGSFEYTEDGYTARWEMVEPMMASLRVHKN